METPKKNIPKVKKKKGDKSATASFFPKNKAVKKGQESRHSFSLLRAFSKLEWQIVGSFKRNFKLNYAILFFLRKTRKEPRHVK
nr:hypothetical protein [Providencia rustigianii]